MTFPSRAATISAALASALTYPFLPDRVATHFDVDGKPHRYGSRLSAALGLPAVLVMLQLVNDRLGAWPGGQDREDAGSGARARDEAVGFVMASGVVNLLSLPASGKRAGRLSMASLLGAVGLSVVYSLAVYLSRGRSSR